MPKPINTPGNEPDGVVYAFGRYELDPVRFELRRDGQPLAIQRQAWEVLAYLMRHRDRVVSKRELLAQAWSGVHVSDGAIHQVISLVRKAVDDDGDAQRVIQTLRGRGIRFVASVHARPTSGASGAESMSSPAPVDAYGLVGRVQEIETITARFERARRGRGGALLVSGEPGVGKTSLLAMTTAALSTRGASVHWGSCRESEGTHPFAPWEQVLRPFWNARGVNVGPSQLLEVERLFPSFATSGPRLVSTDGGEGLGARFGAFEVIATLLREAGKARPVVLAIEDIHAADPSSLRLLEFLSHELDGARVLVLATYRDTEFTLPEGLASVDSLHLAGLDAKTLGQWSRLRFGKPLAPALVAQLVDVTMGNALMVDAVFTAIARDGGPESAASVIADFRVPEPIAHAVRRGLGSLPATTHDLLGLASVIGREFDVAMLRAVAESSAAQVIDALGPALGSWVREVGLGRFAFSHALVRDALYGALPPGTRAALHRRVGEALEGAHARDEVSADTLAHHFVRATPAGDARKAVSYSVEAGRRAHLRLAYEEAVLHFRNALDALALAEPDESVRADVLIDLGTALRCNGEGTLAIETFGRAYEVARSSGDPLRLARATDGYATAQTNIVDRTLIERVVTALSTLGEHDKLLKAKLTAHLARASTFGPDVDQPDRAGRAAVALAREVGDSHTLALALAARRWSLRGTTPLAERTAISTEAVATALAAGDASLACLVRAWTIADHLEAGRRTEVRREMRLQEREAASMRQPYLTLAVLRARTLLANVEGRFADAARCADEAFALAQQCGDQNGTLIYWIARAAPLRAAMRFGEMEPFVKGFLALFPFKHAWSCLYPVLLIESGRVDEARPLFEDLATGDFVQIRRDVNWVTSLSYLAETAALLHDRARSEVLYALMSPYGGQHVVISLGTGFNGPVDRCLGLLAETMGNLDLAIEHYEKALRACDAVHARSYAARTKLHSARARWERNATGDRATARREFAEATSAARRMEQASLLHAAKSLPAGLRG